MDHTEQKDARARLSDGLSGNGAHLNLEDAVADFPQSLINTRPPHVPYSFWHQLEHIRIAQQDLLLYAGTPGHRSPVWPDGYWPQAAAEAGPAEWNATIAAIQRDRGR
ncbi:MAG: DinB family protein, partial [Spirochaetaceae bacterium]